MKNRLPALLILANSQDALTDLCGISLLERLRRIVAKLGFAEAMILSNSVESIAVHAGKSSWRRGEVVLKFQPNDFALVGREAIEEAEEERGGFALLQARSRVGGLVRAAVVEGRHGDDA